MQTTHVLPWGGHYGKGSERRVGRFCLVYGHSAPGLSTPWHSHEASTFTLTLWGANEQRFHGVRVDQGRGSVLFRPAGAIHTDRVSVAGITNFAVEPDSSWLRDHDLQHLLEGAPLETKSPHTSRWLREMLVEYHSPDGLSGLMVEGLLVSLVVDITRAKLGKRVKSPPAWLRRTRELLDEHFSDRLTLTDLAREAGVHPVHLATAFRRTFGLPVGAYVRRRRLDAAHAALIGTRDSIAKIALDCGFSSHSHMTATFARYLGASPSELRTKLTKLP